MFPKFTMRSSTCSAYKHLTFIPYALANVVEDEGDFTVAGVPHFDEPGPARHGTVTELGVQGDRARPGKYGPGKNGIRTNKELD